MGQAPARSDITIVSADNPLRGWLYRPVPWAESVPVADPVQAGRRVPAIVMAHGFSAVKEMGLDRYAAAFSDAGFACVVFDHPGFGASAGTPRQEVDPERQLRAYRDAITWTRGIEGIDPERIGVWGTSFSGGHAVTLAATEPRIRCAVAQIPFLCPPADDIPDQLAQILIADDAARSAGGDPLTIPVVTEEEGGFGALSPDPDSYSWCIEESRQAPGWKNEVTLKSIARLFAYRPLDHVAAAKAPLLIIAARGDVLAPFEFAERARDSMPANCDFVTIDGGHFDAYGPDFGITSQAAIGWFSRWLGDP